MTHRAPFVDRLAYALATRRTFLSRHLPGAALALGAWQTPAAREPVEARALWVNRFEYSSREDIQRIIRRAAETNFNIVYFQVRGAADALYRSELEPCAVGLCGRLGGEPPYDPLEVAVEEGERHGIEIHAWLNALSGWSSGSEESCERLTQPEGELPRHLLLEHPEWAMVDEDGNAMTCPNQVEYVYLSPAYRGVRKALADVARDVVSRYPVRGVHLDRIRYPGREYSYDAESLRRFGRDPKEDPEAWDRFRRSLVNATVRETYEAMTSVDPTLSLSASVWPIYRDRWKWNASQGYSWYYQDPRAWAKGGYLDVAVPMTYDPITRRRCERADWACLAEEHLIAYRERTDRHVYLGVNARNGGEEIVRQIELGRELGAIGFAVYSFSQIDNRDLWSVLARGPFREPATVPPQPWKTPKPAIGDGTGGPIGGE
ncbi:MAG TPA: family 10 glycosylhydrolase [Thermomicrobiales bacterium]